MVLDKHELIGRARELAPALAARALRTEEARAPLDESVRDLIDAGLLATLTPRIYGGHEASVDTMAAITEVLSAACPSTGWVAAFYMGAAWRSMIFPEAGQREFFADKPYLLSAGQAAPLREAHRETNGYRISGRTAWSSGSVHAEWILFMGVVKETAATPRPMVFMVPRAEVEIIDTWHVAGMRGTGSNDAAVDGVFVPDHRAAPFLAALEGHTAGQALHPNPMYRLPYLPFLMCEVVPVLVGALRGAANAMVERTRARTGTLNGVKVAAKQAAQMRVARGLAAAEVAEILMREYLERYMAGRPERNELMDRATMKMKAAWITDHCRNAINDLVRGFGADGFRDESPLQRYFRDINMLAIHGFLDIDTAAETYGRMTLGLAPEDSLL